MSLPIDTTATHLPAQFLQVSQFLAIQELSFPVVTRPNNIVITHDTENQTMTVTATIPVSVSVGANGVTYIAEDYLG